MDASVKAVVVMAAIFALSQLGALAMVSAALGEEYQAFEDPNDPMIPVYYVIAIVLFTFIVLYIIKKKRESIVKYIFIGAVGFTIFYVILIIALVFDTSIVALVASAALAAVLIYLLLKKPEWYVVDATGVLVAVGVIGILGISLNILPVVILLVVLAAYDAISVYGTKHMVALADGVTQMKLPILLVIPKKKGYSYLSQKPLKQQLDDGDEREAMFMGLGDVIIPGILVSSAFYYLADDAVAGVPGNLLVALGALAGGLVGFALLMRFVLRGNPQAGLPLLNGGTVVGYAVAYLLVFQDLSFGISLPW
ncbi:MAG: presenilin family intramembrane aspartyl protease PSH [Candidatus Thermoplasmatota archaeon]